MPTRCPICEKGELREAIIKETLQGTYLGKFPAEVCSACEESFTDRETTRQIESIAKKKGVWGRKLG